VPDPQIPPRPTCRLQWAILLVILSLIAAYLAYALAGQYREIERSERNHLELANRTIKDNLAQHLSSVANALNALIDARAYWQAGGDKALSARRLQTLGQMTGGVLTLFIVATDGRIVAASQPELLDQQVAEHDYFRAASRQPSAGQLHLSPPYRTSEGETTIALSRALFDTCGIFAGVAVAALDPKFFAVIPDSVRYTPDMWALLAHHDGKVFLFSPRRPELEGKNLLLPGSVFAQHLASGQEASILTGISAATGENRLEALRTLAIPGQPIENSMVIEVTRDPAAIFADWQEEALNESAIFLLLSLLTIGGLASYQWRRRQFDTLTQVYAQELQDTADRLLFAAQAAGIGIWEMDPAAQQLTLHSLMSGQYGLPAAAQGDAYKAWRDSILPEDRPALEAALQASLSDGSQFKATFHIRRDDGEIRTVRALGKARGKTGELTRIFGINEDITDLQRAEADLRKLAQAVEQAGEAVMITDAQGLIEYVNRACCDWYGYTHAELIGQNPRLLQSGQTARETYAAMWSRISQGELWRGELVNRRRNGDLLQAAVSITPVRDATGKICNFVGVQKDISAVSAARAMQKEVESRMARIERMDVLGTMAGGIAHDFNNILVAILGYSGIGRLAARGKEGSPRLAGYFEEIELAGERAKALAHQLLTFSRGGRMTIEEVDAAKAIEEAINLIGVTFPRTVTLSAEIAGNLPTLLIERSQLLEVVINLCANARDALAKEGRVRVTAALASIDAPLLCNSCHQGFRGEYLRVAVADDGPGIADDIRQRVFEPFFTTKDVGQGTGMGLPVVHGIAHLYGGHVLIDSTPGCGTEVVVYFPLPP
jgi:PAS domain S-box-containing protein